MILSSKSKSSSSNSVFSRSASSFEKFSQSCDTHASVRFMPSTMQEHSRGIMPKCLNESVFLTFPFKKLWGKLNYFCCAFVPELHILHITCDMILNIFSIIIITMLDIVVMRHYIHKQRYSIICNTKYIASKSSTAMLLLIYTA